MSLIKIGALNAIAVAVKVLSSLAINKILAVYIGPSGYAVIGQLQNVVSMAINLSSGFIASGVIKETAEFFLDPPKQQKIWQTAFKFSFLASLVVAVGLILSSNWIFNWIKFESNPHIILCWILLSIVPISFNNIFIAIINGKKEIKIYVLVNILSSFILLALTSFLTYFYGLYGALVSFIISPAISLIPTLFLIRKKEWFRFESFIGRFDFLAIKQLFKFGIMGIATAIIQPITYILIRENLVDKLGLSAAGYWQASWKISEIYLMMITTTLTAYYLPRLAEIKTGIEIRIEILKIYKIVIPITIFSALSIYMLRDFIINILFTVDFINMRELFPWQLFGDFIKICAFIPAYIMVARVMVKTFVVTEIIFNISFYLFSLIFVSLWGLIGVTIAYAINYSFYLFCIFFISKKVIGDMGGNNHD